MVVKNDSNSKTSFAPSWNLNGIKISEGAIMGSFQMDHNGMLENDGPSLCSNVNLGDMLVTGPNSPKHVPRCLKKDEILVETDKGKRKANVNVDLRLDIFYGGQMSKKKKGEEEVYDGVTIDNRSSWNFCHHLF